MADKTRDTPNRPAFRAHWQLFLLLLPALSLLILFRYLPLFGLVLAFKKYDPRQGILQSPWVGAEHFINFFRYYRFGAILGNTLKLSLYRLFASFPLPILLAIGLNELRKERVKKLIQTVTYLPYFISIVVAVGMMMQLLSPHSGLVNHALAALGGERTDFIGKAANFRHLFVWSDVWQITGYTAVLYIASLSSVDQNLYEAARIDGAGKRQKILYIDLPAILPTIVIMFILEAGKLMSNSFEKVLLLQNSLNLNQSEVLSTYIYKTGLLEGRFDFATAGTFFNSLINFSLLVLVNRIAKKVGDSSLW